MLTRVAQDAERALQAVEEAHELVCDERVAAAHGLLRELIGQDFDIDDDGIPRLYRGTASGRIISTVDTEMRHGRKSQHQRFDGYKLSAAATNTETPLITAIAVAQPQSPTGRRPSTSSTPSPKRGGRAGCWATPPMGSGRSAPSWPTAALTFSPRRRPQGRARPGGWPSTTSRSIPLPGPSPARSGQVAEITREPSGQRRARFAKRACDVCALRERCVQPARGTRQILIQPDEELLLAARQALDDPARAEHLRRTRPRIERLLGLLAHRYGARKSRYFGQAKARLQAAWAAALVNLNPIARHLAAQPA